MMGYLADVSWPAPVGKAVIDLYCRAYDVDLEECLQREGFENFDAFFTRQLRAGARPIPGDPSVLASPADGRIDSVGPIDGRLFTVKGRPYEVHELVGDEQRAKRFEGGTGCVVYLSPRDYHRVHCPVAGKIVSVRSMPGDYYPVNEVGVRHVPNLFVRNRRVAIDIETPGDNGIGLVTVVMVAAMVVGRITVTGIDARDVPLGEHTFDPAREVVQGDEMGIFHLGSTAVVFCEARANLSWVATPGPVRLGQPLAHARAASSPASAATDRGNG